MFGHKSMAARSAAVAAFAVSCCMTLGAQAQGKQLTDADYAQAEKFMSYNVNPLVYHSVNRPEWLDGDRFWYRDPGADGVTYMLVDPARGTKEPAFDQQKLAAALTAAEPNAKQPIEANHLPVTSFTFDGGPEKLTVSTRSGEFHCDLSGQGTCTKDPYAPTGAAGRRARTNTALSPDKTKLAFIRNWNLWVRDLKTGEETQLTTDGVKDFGYATDNAGWTHSDRPIVLWSPDSKKIATFQQDQRKDGEMYLVQVTNRHPHLEAWKYPLVGDKNVTMIERVVIDVPTKKVVRFKMPPDQHRSTLCDDVSCYGGWEDVQWAPDSKSLAFVSTSRDHKHEWLRVANPETGDIREVMQEVVPYFYESGNGKVNWHYLPKSNEILWFSERDNWGQLYLYDLTTGKLKNQITHGEGNVTQVLHIDQKNRVIYFLAVGKQPGVDPYFQQYYRINFDGTGMKLLTPEKEDHAIYPSEDGRYFIDVYSTATKPQVAVVRDDEGKVVQQVAKEDISKLLATGWKPPVPIKVKARDGVTDLYGFMFEPTNLDKSKKYPIVNNVYPGPQTGSCGARTFAAAHGDRQSLAELGFIVVCIDGMGTPWRSKKFHEFYYGNMGDNTIPDQVSGMKDLAKQYPFIDIDKAGMYGHSGGGNATAAAMFHFPDFFKVGIAESGNHDEREYEDDWGEKWAGLEVIGPDGKSNYDSQANQNYAQNLKGHLLLAHGTFDDNVPPNETLLVVNALIKANKDFDLLMIPNVHHGYAWASQYMTRRRWDYFVRYLAGNIPPHEYKMKSYEEVLRAMSGPNAGVDDGTGQY